MPKGETLAADLGQTVCRLGQTGAMIQEGNELGLAGFGRRLPPYTLGLADLGNALPIAALVDGLHRTLEQRAMTLE
jgi:hypothetical protein